MLATYWLTIPFSFDPSTQGTSEHLRNSLCSPLSFLIFPKLRKGCSLDAKTWDGDDPKLRWHDSGAVGLAVERSRANEDDMHGIAQ
jgi:hypothetical protein